MMDRNEELRLLENYPNDKVIKVPAAFCAVSSQSSLSEEREFMHSTVKKKGWQWKWQGGDKHWTKKRRMR
jgi:hypothetical protein